MTRPRGSAVSQWPDADDFHVSPLNTSLRRSLGAIPNAKAILPQQRLETPRHGEKTHAHYYSRSGLRKEGGRKKDKWSTIKLSNSDKRAAEVIVEAATDEIHGTSSASWKSLRGSREKDRSLVRDMTELTAAEGIKSLFVGSLSWDFNEVCLYREFKHFGTITDCRVIRDSESGRSHGYGYVEFESAEAAARAQHEMMGYELDGRPLTVDFSTLRQESANKISGYTNRFGDQRSAHSTNPAFDCTNNSKAVSEAFEKSNCYQLSHSASTQQATPSKWDRQLQTAQLKKKLQEAQEKLRLQERANKEDKEVARSATEVKVLQECNPYSFNDAPTWDQDKSFDDTDSATGSFILSSFTTPQRSSSPSASIDASERSWENGGLTEGLLNDFNDDTAAAYSNTSTPRHNTPSFGSGDHDINMLFNGTQAPAELDRDTKEIRGGTWEQVRADESVRSLQCCHCDVVFSTHSLAAFCPGCGQSSGIHLYRVASPDNAESVLHTSLQSTVEDEPATVSPAPPRTPWLGGILSKQGDGIRGEWASVSRALRTTAEDGRKRWEQIKPKDDSHGDVENLGDNGIIDLSRDVSHPAHQSITNAATAIKPPAGSSADAPATAPVAWTERHDQKLLMLKTENVPWSCIAEVLEKEPFQCQERFKQIKPRDWKPKGAKSKVSARKSAAKKKKNASSTSDKELHDVPVNGGESGIHVDYGTDFKGVDGKADVDDNRAEVQGFACATGGWSEPSSVRHHNCDGLEGCCQRSTFLPTSSKPNQTDAGRANKDDDKKDVWGDALGNDTADGHSHLRGNARSSQGDVWQPAPLWDADGHSEDIAPHWPSGPWDSRRTSEEVVNDVVWASDQVQCPGCGEPKHWYPYEECGYPSYHTAAFKPCTITYWATIESNGKEIQVPIKDKHVSGPEKTIVSIGMPKVWKWIHNKGLGDKVGLQDAFDLAQSMNEKEIENKYVHAWGSCS